MCGKVNPRKVEVDPATDRRCAFLVNVARFSWSLTCRCPRDPQSYVSLVSCDGKNHPRLPGPHVLRHVPTLREAGDLTGLRLRRVRKLAFLWIVWLVLLEFLFVTALIHQVARVRRGRPHGKSKLTPRRTGGALSSFTTLYFHGA